MNVVDFERLVREYMPMVRSLVYHFTRNPNDVDDIAQDVFIKAYQALPTFRGGSIRAFLGRIVRNHCYDLFRKQRNRKAFAALELIAEDMPSTANGPEETVVNRSLVDEVSAILERLNPVDKEIMLLRHVHQFSYEEIALVMNMRPGAVRTRVARARQRVVEEIERRERRESPIVG